VVLDDRGAPLVSAAGGSDQAAASEVLDQQAKAEQDLRARATQLLNQALPGQAFSVSVDVALNYDHIKRVSEHLIAQGKDGNGLLSHLKTNSTGRLTGDPEPDGNRPSSASIGQESDYAHGREQEEYESAPGRIQRITVGVVVPTSLPQAQVTRLEDVVAAGLGLDLTRGDRVRIAGFAAVQPPTSVVTPAAAVPVIAAVTTPALSSPSTSHLPIPALSTAIFAGLALLVALGFALAIRSQDVTPRLTREERDDLLRKMTTWVEEGAAP
jgi:flagellar M-ring protein FliF